MKKKIKLSIISTLLLTSTLTITLPIVSCSSSTNPTIPTNPPIYTIDATRFDSNKLVKINKVISSIVNDPNSTTQQKITRYRNLNAYANNSELIKSVNDYFFLIDKNNNDRIIKDVIESIEIIPTSNPTLTFNVAMPKVTIKINVKQEFRKDMEDINFSSYSFDTGTLDRLGFVNLRIQIDTTAWRNYVMNYIGTNPGNNFTFAQQTEKITTANFFNLTWSRVGSTPQPPIEAFPGLWDAFKNFFSVYIASSSTPINQNLPFIAIRSTLRGIPAVGQQLFFYLGFTPHDRNSPINIFGNIYNIADINSVATNVVNGETANFDPKVNFGWFANS